MGWTKDEAVFLLLRPFGVPYLSLDTPAAKRTTSIWTTTAIDEATMLTTKRKPVGVGEILIEEFMHPIGLTQAALAKAMGVPRKHVNELCNGRRSVTAATALILARVFANSPEFG